MPDAALTFHFLRPWWLAALLPVLLIVWVMRRRERADAQWGDAIAPHLLAHLVVKPQAGWRVRPLWLIAAAAVLAIVAAAGPSWRREVPPFVEDKAPLMIALGVSSSMGRTDVAPTRLERGKQKVRDLLAVRAGARTGLIAYAGTAHLVMPLTDDRGVIEPFLAALAPGLMPVDGKRADAATALAAGTMATETVAGTVLLIADALGNVDASALRQAAGRNDALILAVAPPDQADAFGPELSRQVVQVSVDDSDIRAVERRIETRFQAAQADQAGARWRDDGYWLLFPGALLGLLWFRRGTTLQWMLLLALLPAVLLHPAPARADEPSRFRDWWITPDQQG